MVPLPLALPLLVVLLALLALVHVLLRLLLQHTRLLFAPLVLLGLLKLLSLQEYGLK